MKRLIIIFLASIAIVGSSSAQSFVGKLNPNPVVNKSGFSLGDSLNILAVLVDFPEDKDDATFGNGKFGSIYSEDYGITILDPLPHNGEYFEDHLTFAKNYFTKVSKEKFHVSYTVLGDILTVSKTMRNYTPPINDLSDLSPLADFTEEVWNLADVHYTNVDFSNYDLFVIFHAGVGKDVSLPGSIGNERDLPSVYLSPKTFQNIYGEDFQGYPVNDGNFNISNSAILPETESRELSGFSGTTLIELTINGLIAATIGSHLGLPDLYNTNTGLSAIGRFGLMDGQAMFTYQGIFPPEMSPWEKMFLGWETPIELPVGNRAINLTARYAAELGDTSLIKIPINSTEYYLIENRKRDAKKDGSTVTYKTGGHIFTKTFDRDYPTYIYYDVDTLQGVILDVDEYDWAVPGEDRNYKMENFVDVGIVIWHIDEKVIADNYESNTINNDKFNRGVAIVEADGVQDIGEEYTTIFGDIVIGEGTKEDTWYQPNPAELFTNKFGANTKPSTISNSGANSLITMSNFSGIGSKMSFSIAYGSDEIELLSNFNLGDHLNAKWLSSVNNGNEVVHFAFSNNQIVKFNSNEIIYKSSPSRLVFNVIINKPLLIGSVGREIIVSTNNTILKLNIFVGASRDTLSTTIDENDSYSTSPVFYSKANDVIEFLIGTINGRILRYSIDLVSRTISLIEAKQVFDTPITQIAKKDNNYNAISEEFYWSSEFNTSDNPIEIGEKAIQLANIFNNQTNVTVIQTEYSLITVANLIELNIIKRNSDSSFFALSDIKNDGANYIIQNNGEYLNAFNLLGSSANNFPFQDEFYSTFYSSPLSVDLNNDEAGEIITFTENGKIIAVDGKTGKIIDGFPLSSGGKVATVPVIFSENGKTGLSLITEDNQFMSWYISQTDGKKFWTEENGSPSNASFVEVAKDTEAISEFFPQSKAYNWPNPVYEGTTNIRYYVSEDSDAEVTIFDLAGDLVAKLSGKGMGGFDNEIIWDVSEIQSGAYFAHLKVTGSSGKTDTKIIKIAVIK